MKQSHGSVIITISSRCRCSIKIVKSSNAKIVNLSDTISHGTEEQIFHPQQKRNGQSNTCVTKTIGPTAIKSRFFLILRFVFKIPNDSLIIINSKVIYINCRVYYFVQRTINIT